MLHVFPPPEKPETAGTSLTSWERERETEPATWAVCDGVPIKTLDAKGSGELPWLAILSVSHLVARRWRHQ